MYKCKRICVCNAEFVIELHQIRPLTLALSFLLLFISRFFRCSRWFALSYANGYRRLSKKHFLQICSVRSSVMWLNHIGILKCNKRWWPKWKASRRTSIKRNANRFSFLGRFVPEGRGKSQFRKNNSVDHGVIRTSQRTRWQPANRAGVNEMKLPRLQKPNEFL